MAGKGQGKMLQQLTKKALQDARENALVSNQLLLVDCEQLTESVLSFHIPYS